MSIKCPKCGNELPEESKFCSKCGYKVNSKMKLSTKIKNRIGFIKNKFIILILIIAVVIIVGLIMYIKNPVIAYENDIKNNKLSDAANLYTNKISNNEGRKQKILEFLKNQVVDTKQDFIKQKISYDKAINKLSNISQTGLLDNVTGTSNYINKLNNSRLAFKKGEEYYKNNDIENALKFYKEVIKEDSNYSTANAKINNLTSKYKS